MAAAHAAPHSPMRGRPDGGSREEGIMKILIVFDTKHGTTLKVATRIADALKAKGTEAELRDLRAKGAAAASLAGYDAVVLGGPFYMGMWSKRARAFAAGRETELAAAGLALFAIGSNAELGDKAAKAALPGTLASGISLSAYFGGSLDYDALGPLERFIVKKVSGKAESSSTLDLAAVDAFAVSLASAKSAKAVKGGAK